MFVPNFTNQFFRYILHRNNTKRSAKIIYTDGDMGLLMLEHFQNIPDFCMLINEQQFRHNLHNRLIRSIHAGKMLTYAAIIRAVWGYSDYGSIKKL